MTTPAATHHRAGMLIAGVNHLSSDVELRDRLLLRKEAADALRKAALSAPEILEVSVLSTCHRAEVHAVTKDPDAARDVLLDAWSSLSGVPVDAISTHAYVYAGEDALRHLFRVSASLDSIVIGESQIFGQVKQAYENAKVAETVGTYLNHAYLAAIRVGKRVRSDTTINEGAVSISYAAVELARKVFGNLSETTVGIIGSGEMGSLAAHHLHKADAGHFVIFNRSAAPAEELAAELGGKVCLLDRIEEQLHECDVVISATDAPNYVLSRETVQTALRKRSDSRLFLIDISAPRDIDPAVGDLPNTYLFTIDDLKQVVRDNEQKRQDAVADATRIIEEELAGARAWYLGLDVRPVIQELRSKYEGIADDATRSAGRNLDPQERERLEAFSRSLLNKFLHTPLTRLKEIGEEGNGSAAGYYANELFGLSADKDIDDGSGPDDPNESTGPAKNDAG